VYNLLILEEKQKPPLPTQCPKKTCSSGHNITIQTTTIVMTAYTAPCFWVRYSVVQMNMSMLTKTLYSSLIMKIVYNNTKYSVPFMIF